jgi:hypothetical protein
LTEEKNGKWLPIACPETSNETVLELNEHSLNGMNGEESISFLFSIND